MRNPTTFVCSGGTEGAFKKGKGVNLTCEIRGMTQNFDVSNPTPIITPFGFASLPDKNYYAAVLYPGSYGQTPFVIGFGGDVSNENPLDVQVGETALFNNSGFTLELKLKEIRARFNDISCKLMNGDSTARILLDLLNEILNYVDYSNSTWTTKFNIHTHTVSSIPIDTASLSVIAPNGGGACTVSGSTVPSPPTVSSGPTPSASTYTLGGNINPDKTYLDDAKGFIDDKGETL